MTAMAVVGSVALGTLLIGEVDAQAGGHLGFAAGVERGQGDDNRGMPRQSAEEQGVGRVQARGQVDDNGTEVAGHAGRIARLDRRRGGLEEVHLVVQARLTAAALVFSDGVEGGPGSGRGGVEDPARVGAEIAAAAQLQRQRGDEIDKARLVGAPGEHLPGGAQGAADQGGTGHRRERGAPLARQPRRAQGLRKLRQDQKPNARVPLPGQPAAQVQPEVVAGHDHDHRAQRVARLELADQPDQPRRRRRAGAHADHLERRRGGHLS